MTAEFEYIHESLRSLAVPIESLRPDPKNARKHGEKNLAAIEASLRRFGQRQALVVQREGMIVRAGNGRIEVAKRLGWTHVAAVIVDEADVEATAFALADNRTAELAEWDDDALGKLLASLPDGPLSATGFDADMIAQLSGVANESEDDTPEPLAEAATSPGDVWILGRHRLMCGNSTVAEDVLRLMNGEKAALCSTDPPYLVDYTGDRPNDTGKDWSATYREVEIKDAAWFFRGVFENVLKVIAPKAAIYCWHAHKRCGEIQKVWADLGILDHQQIIWVKPTPVFGRVHWHFQHEPCMMGWRKGGIPEHNGDHSISSVWEIDWEGKSRIVGNEHPTQKPVEIFARPMRKHTKMDEVCYEPFSGSGSQIVAAEQERRRCFAMELEPVFVDVAVRRWQRLTGLDATLEESGRTWREVAADRGVTLVE